jgi:hypothetical protein
MNLDKRIEKEFIIITNNEIVHSESSYEKAIKYARDRYPNNFMVINKNYYVNFFQRKCKTR